MHKQQFDFSGTATKQSRYRYGWRSQMVVMSLGVVWLILAGRLVYLQGINRSSLADRAEKQHSFAEVIPSRPGDILDRHGRLLATTVTARSLYVVPSQIEKPEEIVQSLSSALKMNPRDLQRRLSKHRTSHFLWVKRRMTDSEAENVRQLKLPNNVWGFREEYLRRYPQGILAAHVIGLRDIDGNGRGGVEQSLNDALQGKDGKRILMRDARGHVIHIKEKLTESPRHGRSVVLALDSVIQLYTEQVLDGLMQDWKPKNACICVLDPKTCDILAMASRPAFDPNDPVNVPAAAWKNTNIASVYEPGSTFKPFIVSWGIETGAVKSDEIFHCGNGEYKMGPRILHDHHPYGNLNVVNILVKSSNVGMAKIGERLTNRGLHEATRLFGFGRKTGSGLPGELVGVVRPLKEWTSYSTGSIPMGQEISVTPLQMIVAHAALANGGKLKSPRLVLKYGSDLSAEKRYRREPAPQIQMVSRIISPETARWMVREPMTQVVKRGTGTKAKLEDYTVFGKTGTAQKFDPKTGKYSSQRHVSSFICGAPAEDPQVLVLVMVNEPTVGKTHYGGTIAAPAAAEVLRKTLVQLRVPADGNLLRAAGR